MKWIKNDEWRRVLPVFWVILIFQWIWQLENLFCFRSEITGPSYFLFLIPSITVWAQTIILSLPFVIFRRGSLFAIIPTFIAHLYLLLEQGHLHTFWTHFAWMDIEQEFTLNSKALFPLVDSMKAGFGPYFFLNLIISLGLILIVRKFKIFLEQKTNRPSVRGAGLGLFFVALVQFGVFGQHVLIESPFLVLFAKARKIPIKNKAKSWQELILPIYNDNEKQQASSLEKDYLEKTLRKPAKNVIFIILESVGALQIFSPKGNHTFDREVTPNLAQLQSKMLIYPVIYNYFPGTTRTHMPINTGGRTIIFGNAARELKFPYRGPAIPIWFKNEGYETGLFSASGLDFESLNFLYQQFDYSKWFSPEVLNEEEKRAYHLNSWGIDERPVLEKMKKWIGDKKAEGKNFFAQYLTVGTHHPYSIPKDINPLFPVKNPKLSYLNALHFSDRMIGELISFLKNENLLNETVVVIMGDHGQAFGEINKRNWLHRNYLYDENIRNFMLVLDFARIDGPIISNFKGQIGDVFPTIAQLVGKSFTEAFGQSLLKEEMDERIFFFHKNVRPEMCGLRDGRFKFIGELKNREAEIYDLNTDPLEQKKLDSFPRNRVDNYFERCQEWMQVMEGSYHQQSIGEVKGIIRSIDIVKEDKSKNLYKADIITGSEDFFLWVQFKDTAVLGAREFQAVYQSNGMQVATTTLFQYQNFKEIIKQLPLHLLQNGPGLVQIFQQGKMIAEMKFSVELSRTDRKNLKPKSPTVKITMGELREGQIWKEKKEWGPISPVSIKLSINSHEIIPLTLEIENPDGVIKSENLAIERGVGDVYRPYLELPKKIGKWKVRVLDQDKKILAFNSFQVLLKKGIKKEQGDPLRELIHKARELKKSRLKNHP